MKLVEVFKDIFKGVRIENDKSIAAINAYVIDLKDVDSCVINYKREEAMSIQMKVKDKYFLKPKDILIGIIPSGTTSHVGYCQELNDNELVIIKKHFIVLRNPYNDNFNLEFIAEYLENFGIKKIFDNTPFRELTLEEIENIELPNVPLEKQEEIVNLIHPINERSRLYNKLIQNDIQIKKYIMNEAIKND